MIDNIIKDDNVDATKLLLIVPPGVQPEQSFPLKVSEVDLRTLLTLIASQDTVYPVVVTIEPELIAPITKIVGKLGINIRVLDGLEGEYPSYWRLQAAVLPHMAAAEIKAAAATAKLEREAKGPQIDMKGLRPEQTGEIQTLAKENWDAPAE